MIIIQHFLEKSSGFKSPNAREYSKTTSDCFGSFVEIRYIFMVGQEVYYYICSMAFTTVCLL